MAKYSSSHRNGRNGIWQATMEQLYLLAPPEIIKNKAMKALTGEEFVQSEKYWREVELLDPGNTFIGAALDICRFWNDPYPDEDMLNQADPLEVYRAWREFETYLRSKDYRGSVIIGQIKEHIFLRRIGLEHMSPALRESFERHGIEVLDLLMEIEKWALAVEEIRMVRVRNPSRVGGAFFLKCSEVYFKAGNIPASRRFLLQAFWDEPDLIELRDIVDPEILDELEGLYPDYDTRQDSVELIPYVGLMEGSFTLPLEDRLQYLSNLRKNAERHETGNDGTASTKTRYRLFSLYAWESELAQLIGAGFVDARNRMRMLDSELFMHYMERKQHLEVGRISSSRR
jgi:hypothetical protein